MVDRADTTYLEGDLRAVRDRCLNTGQQFGKVFRAGKALRLTEGIFIEQQDRSGNALDRERLPRGRNHDNLVVSGLVLARSLRDGSAGDRAGNKRDDRTTGGFHSGSRRWERAGHVTPSGTRRCLREAEYGLPSSPHPLLQRCCLSDLASGYPGEISVCSDACEQGPYLRFRPELPEVMRSGFGGGFHSGGGIGRCLLVPRPMAPGRWRTRPEVSARAASAASAPPRRRLMRSRIRRASSKSRALAAASMSRCKSSIVLSIFLQRIGPHFGASASRQDPPAMGAGASAGGEPLVTIDDRAQGSRGRAALIGVGTIASGDGATATGPRLAGPCTCKGRKW